MQQTPRRNYRFPLVPQFSSKPQDILCDLVRELLGNALVLPGQVVDLREKALESSLKTEFRILIFLLWRKILYQFPEIEKR